MADGKKMSVMQTSVVQKNLKKYQKELENEVSALKNIHEALGSGAWKLQYNEKGEMISCRWSDTMRRMLGFTSVEDFPDEFSSWSDRLHPDVKEQILEEYRSTVEDYSGGKTYDTEQWLMAKDGTYHWFRAAGRLSRRADGSPIAFDGVFISTDEKHETNEKLHRALEEAEKARNELLLEHEVVSAVSRISIRTRELPSQKEGYIDIETVVEDNGIGMSKEFLPHLFDSFSRERNTTAGKIAGSGLGMSIVKSMVELMDGTIAVESELGKGTKFTVTVPHKLADKEYYEKKALSRSTASMDFSGKRILLAEDNELNAEIATAILEEMGFSVDWAEDGVICVDKLEKSEDSAYDLVLMDIQMPNMDGYKATQIIRRLPDKMKSGIPIIAMTANAFDEDRKKALAIGMDGHIPKPVDVDRIKETLASILKPIGM